jgi:hypothetical protein
MESASGCRPSASVLASQRSGIRFFSSIPRAAGRPEAVLPVPESVLALARLAALGGRLPDPGGDDRLRLDWSGPDPVDARR